MKMKWGITFEEYMYGQSGSDHDAVERFYRDFDDHCRLRHDEKKMLWEDFEKAILYYADIGVSLQRALELLDIRYLGDFYERQPERWFPLDDAAKLYPLSMDHRRMSTYRISVYLKEPVAAELLQMALNFTVKRFPSFATTLKKGFFWHYLDMTRRRFYIEPETDIPCQPIKVGRSGSKSFHIFYHENRISFECFHALSDGLGAVNLLKSLAAEYLRLTGKDIVLDDTVMDIDSVPEEEEFENAFARIHHKTYSDPISSVSNKAAVQMKGKLADNMPCRIVHLKMDASELKSVSEKYDTTVARYLLALMFIAGKAASDEHGGDMNIQVPVNLRKFYPSKTLANFVLPCGICLPMETIDDVSSIIGEIDRQMRRKTSKEAMEEALASAESLINMVKFVPLTVKQYAAKAGYGFLGDKAFTSILSDLGVIRMPSSVSEHIESMDAVIGTAITQRARCVAVTFSDTTTLSITKATEDPTFEEKLYELIYSDGITVRAEGSEIYGN